MPVPDDLVSKIFVIENSLTMDLLPLETRRIAKNLPSILYCLFRMLEHPEQPFQWQMFLGFYLCDAMRMTENRERLNSLLQDATTLKNYLTEAGYFCESEEWLNVTEEFFSFVETSYSNL